MATLLAEFNAYLDRDHADPTADAVGYRQHALWLSPDEDLPAISATMIRIAMIDNLIKRAGGETTPTWRDPQTT